MTTILAAFDFSPEVDSTDSIMRAIELLARHEQVRIHAVHAFEPQLPIDDYSTVFDSGVLADQERATIRLESIRVELEKRGHVATARVVRGEPGAAVVEASELCGADFIVLGAQGQGVLRNLFLGTTAMYVLKHAPCPVLVMPVRAAGLSGPHAVRSMLPGAS